MHEGIDIIVDKMTPLVSAVDGRVTFVTETEESWGMAIYVEDADGYSYRYLHVNNDTPGTDDNKAIRAYAFPNSIQRGTIVTAGQVIAFAGDSGNAESVHAHLHFEIWTPGDGSRYYSDRGRESINPYPSLMAAIGKPVVTNNPTAPSTPSVSNYQFTRNLDLGSTGEDVRELQKYLNRNGFTISAGGAGSPGNETTYFGYATQTALIKFQKANNISPAVGYFGPLTRAVVNSMPQTTTTASIKAGWLVKDPNDPKVYYVNDALQLQWITSEKAALDHFGPTWIAQLRDIAGLQNMGLTIGQNIQ